MSGTLNVHDFSILPKGGYYRSPTKSNYDGTGRFTYEWELRDFSYPYALDANGNAIPNQGTADPDIPSEMAAGNRLVQATAHVYDTLKSNSRPVAPYTQLVTVFDYTQQFAQNNFTLTIDLLVDFSTSMSFSPWYTLSEGPYSGNGLGIQWISRGEDFHAFGPPYMVDRYFRRDTPSSQVTLAPMDNTQLDIVGLSNVDDPDTPYVDHYPTQTSPTQSTLGAPTCNQINADYPLFTSRNPSSLLRNYFYQDYGWAHGGDVQDGIGGTTVFNWYVNSICKRDQDIATLYSGNANAYNAEMLSKIELLPSVLLMMLVKIESDRNLIDNMKLGLSVFGTSYLNVLPVASPVILPPEGPPEQRRPYFEALRRQLLWINRYDLTPPGNNQANSRSFTPMNNNYLTNIQAGLTNSANKLNLAAPNSSDKKLMIFISDGEPTVGASFPALYTTADTHLAANNIQLITLGWFTGNALENRLRILAQRTPNGQFYDVNSTTIKNISEKLASEIAAIQIKGQLCSAVIRYNLTCT